MGKKNKLALKSLDIQGFKTFAQSARIDFTAKRIFCGARQRHAHIRKHKNRQLKRQRACDASGQNNWHYDR